VSKSEKEVPMDLVDMLATLLLKDLILLGFPTPDPKQQVSLAYTYAELMFERRSAEIHHDDTAS